MMKTMNLTQLAEHIGINKRTLHRMVLDGRFPVKSLTATAPRRWSVEAVDNWLRGEQ